MSKWAPVCEKAHSCKSAKPQQCKRPGPKASKWMTSCVQKQSILMAWAFVAPRQPQQHPPPQQSSRPPRHPWVVVLKRCLQARGTYSKVSSAHAVICHVSNKWNTCELLVFSSTAAVASSSAGLSYMYVFMHTTAKIMFYIFIKILLSDSTPPEKKRPSATQTGLSHCPVRMTTKIGCTFVYQVACPPPRPQLQC